MITQHKEYYTGFCKVSFLEFAPQKRVYKIEQDIFYLDFPYIQFVSIEYCHFYHIFYATFSPKSVEIIPHYFKAKRLPLLNIGTTNSVCLEMPICHGNIFDCVDYFWNSQNNLDLSNSLQYYLRNKLKENPNFWGIAKENPNLCDATNAVIQSNSIFSPLYKVNYEDVKIFFKKWQENGYCFDLEEQEIELYAETNKEPPQIMDFFELNYKQRVEILKELGLNQREMANSHADEFKMYKDKIIKMCQGKKQ